MSSHPLRVLPDTTGGSPTFRVREWTLDDGLPAQVESVAQDSSGYLWLATFEGLARFDGVRFELFTPETTPVFRSDQVLSVYVTRSGDLWVGSRDRWAYLLHNGEWTAFSLNEAYGGEHWVGGFAEDAEGTLWAISTGQYLARFDGRQWSRFTDRLDGVWPLFNVDASGTLWSELHPDQAPDASEGLLGSGITARLDGSRFEPVVDDRLVGFSPTQYGPLLHRAAGTEAEFARDGRIRMDLTDAEGRLLTWMWYDERTSRVMLVDRSGRAWVQLSDAEGQNALAVVKDGRELARFEPEGATWFEQVFEDRQGAIWTFASSTGLLRVTEDPFQRYTTDDGVPRYAVRASSSATGDVIVSTESTADDVRAAAIGDGRVSTLTYRPDRVPARMEHLVQGGKVSVGQVIEDTRGQRWGVADSYLLRLDGDGAEIVLPAGRFSLRAIAADASDPDVLWVGNIRGMVYRLDTEAKVVTDSFRVGPPDAQTIRGLHPAPAGHVWVATDDGMVEITRDHVLRSLPAFQGRSIRAFDDGPDGTMWAATDRGLVRVRKGAAGVLGSREGLPKADLSTVQIDNAGFVWVSSGRVLYRLRLDEAEAVLDGERARLDVVTLTPSDGHLGTAPEVWGTAEDPDGGLWLPSNRGVTRVDPMLYARQHPQAPEVVPEGITTETGDTFAFSPDVTLPIGQRTLTLSYTATDLLAPDHVRFRTYLEGHDAGWVDRGAERRAVYGGLEPGRYTLWVQAMSAGGIWSEPVAAPVFDVPSRFYETAWFLVLCALAVGLALVAAYRGRVRHLRRREVALGALVDERTEALRMEKRKTEAQAEKLRQMDAAKGRFFANVSHELRTPLALLLGPIQDLRRGRFRIDPEAAPLLDCADANGRRLQRLVEDLLTLTQADGGALTLQRRRFDLVGFVRDRVSAFGSRAEAAGVVLQFEADVDRLDVDADPAKIETVVYNLVGNAIKFTPAGGAVTVSVSLEPGGGARLSVADTGIGVAPTDLKHLFDRFYQADTEASRVGSGAGIGLALVREIAELHGGTVRAESGLGTGTTITVCLPPTGLAGSEPDSAVDVAPSLPPPIVTPFESGDGQGGEFPRFEGDDSEDERPLVLVVEDNGDLRVYLRSLLGAHYRVEEAADGAGGLSTAIDIVPDLIVSDVMMPGIDGFTLLAALKGDLRTSHVPVVLLTARADAESRLTGLARGADAYLAKPFDGAELEATVANLLDNRRRLRDAWGGSRDAPSPEASVDEAPALEPDEAAFLDRVGEVVAANLSAAAFGAAALAESLGMSPRQLRRKLSALTGESTGAFVRRARLERAAALLADGTRSVKEIQFEVGFASAHGFASAFRDRFGTAPSAYAAGSAEESDVEEA